MADQSRTVELEVSVEVLHHDHETMNKVYHAIWSAMGIPKGPRALEHVTSENMKLSQAIVSEMQNAGILFRERKPNG